MTQNVNDIIEALPHDRQRKIEERATNLKVTFSAGRLLSQIPSETIWLAPS
jgi:hypothetical protein